MLAEHYRAQRDGLMQAIRTSGATGDEPVPACPGWTVADVVRHLVGLADNWLTADLEVYASPQWTDAQVAAWSHASLDELFEAWTDRDAFPAMLDDLGAVESLPEQITTVIGVVPTSTFGEGIISDLTHHCYDVASALNVNLTDERGTVALLTKRATGGVHRQWKFAGHEPVRVVSIEDGELGIIGGKEASTSVVATRLDLFRSMGGRRTAQQIQALDWSPGPPPVETLGDFVIRFFALPEDFVEPLAGA